MSKWFLLPLLALLCALPIQRAAGDDRYASLVRVAGTGGVILHADHADSPRAPASLTKLMTLYLLFEALERGDAALADEVVISREVASTMPFKLGLREGERVSLDLLMRATAIRSANDAAVAIAEHLSGSEEQFARHMIERARKLGMVRTRFLSASGLPRQGQFTTARDMALLSDAILRDFPQYQSLFRETSVTYRGKKFPTTNGFLWSVEGADGLKTGYTKRAGYNLSATATRDGTRLIAIVLGGTGTRARNAHAAALVDAGFNRWQALQSERSQAQIHLVSHGPRDRLLRRDSHAGWAARFGPPSDHEKALHRARVSRSLLPSEQVLASAEAFRRDDGAYLAELRGLSAEGAQNACRTLPAPCILVPPAQ
jgi:D-alanyl-D-alanine carboxypeptidase (penicillin-binding protein 5/6)